MSSFTALFRLSLVLSLAAPALAELPLPDATFFGKISTPDGTPVGAGSLTASIRRAGAAVLSVPGAFVTAEGEVWYVVHVPLETNIGAPGPSGLAAREGDVLEALFLAGVAVESGVPPPALAAGRAQRLDATVDAPVGPVFFRGDCSPDLKVSITDAVRVLNYLFVAPVRPPCLEACDGDGNGTLNITDGVYLLLYLFVGGPAPPAPGPQCGADPSPSTLGCAQTSCTA